MTEEQTPKFKGKPARLEPDGEYGVEIADPESDPQPGDLVLSVAQNGTERLRAIIGIYAWREWQGTNFCKVIVDGGDTSGDPYFTGIGEDEGGKTIYGVMIRNELAERGKAVAVPRKDGTKSHVFLLEPVPGREGEEAGVWFMSGKNPQFCQVTIPVLAKTTPAPEQRPAPPRPAVTPDAVRQAAAEPLPPTDNSVKPYFPEEGDEEVPF